jgi:hypothetical protein
MRPRTRREREAKIESSASIKFVWCHRCRDGNIAPEGGKRLRLLSPIEKAFYAASFAQRRDQKRVWLLMQSPETCLEEPSSAIIAVDLVIEADKDRHKFSGDKNQPVFLVFTAGSDLDGLQNDHGAQRTDLLRFVESGGPRSEIISMLSSKTDHVRDRSHAWATAWTRASEAMAPLASSLTILGLAAAILALGSVHWLVRDQDRKDAAEQDQAQGTAD